MGCAWIFAAIVGSCGLPAAPAPRGPTVPRETRTFPIRFLTETIPDFPLSHAASRAWPLGLLIRSPDEPEEEEGTGLAFAAEEEERRGFPAPPLFPEEAALLREEPEAVPRWTRIDPPALVDLIRRNVAEDSWANERNRIEADEETLTVRQTPEVLEEIVRLLSRLRARRARMISVEVAVVPVEALSEAQRRGSPWLASEAFDRVLARAGAGATRIALMAYDGQTVSAHAGPRRAMLTDREVNQTGISPVGNIVVRTVSTGILAEVRPDTIAGTDWISLRLRVIRRRFAGDPETREAVFGQFEFVRIAEARLTTTTMARAGGAVLAGTLEGDEAVGTLAAVARVRPLSLAGPAEAARHPEHGLILRVYPIRFLMGASWAVAPALVTRPTTPEALEAYLRAHVDPESWNDARVRVEADKSKLTVVQRPAVHEAIRRLLDGWLAEATCLVTIDLRTVRGDRRALDRLASIAKPGGVLPEDWAERVGEGLEPVATARLAGVPGTRLGAHGRILRTYVADYECVSGGTGWTATNLPDPLVQSAGSGCGLTASPRLEPGGRACIAIEALSAQTAFGRTATFNAPWGLAPSAVVLPGGEEGDDGSGGEPEEEPAAAGRITVPVPVRIDLPSQEAWVLNRDLPIPLDMPVLLESRGDGTGKKAGRATVARVRLWRGEERRPRRGAPARPPSRARREARIFEVGLLTTPPGQARLSTRMPGSLILRSPDEEYEEPGGEFPFGMSSLQEEEELPYGCALEAGDLVKLIRSSIAEDSWSNARNRIEYRYGELTVVQTPDVLDRIESFLEALYARRLRQVDLDIAIVPPEAAAGGGLDEAIAAAGDEAIRWHVTADEGEGLVLEPAARTAAITDYEVNQTGTMPVRNPVVRILRSGLAIRMRASATPAAGLSWLEFELRNLDSRPLPARRVLPMGELEFVESAGARLAGSVLARAGETVVLGELVWPERRPGSFAVLARVRPVPVPEPERPIVRVLDAGILLRPWSDGGDVGGLAGGEQENAPLLEASALRKALLDALPPDLAADPRLRLSQAGACFFLGVSDDPAATARAAEAAARRLRAIFERRVRPAGLRLWLGSVAAADLAKATDAQAGRTLLVANWREALKPERATAVRLAGLAGRPLSIRAARGRTYLADVEKVSGGTGKLVVEVPDPIIQWAGTGVALRGTVRPVAGNPWIGLRLAGAAAETAFGRTLWLRADDRVALDPKAGIRSIGAKIAVDLPEQTARTWRHIVAIPAGRACLLGAFPDPRDPGKLRILVVEGTVE